MDVGEIKKEEDSFLMNFIYTFIGIIALVGVGVWSAIMFFLGLLVLVLAIIGVFEYGNIIADLSIIEFSFFIGCFYLMIRNHLIAKENNRNLILAQFNPIRILGSIFLIASIVFSVIIMFRVKYSAYEFDLDSILASNWLVLVLLVTICFSYFNGSLDPIYDESLIDVEGAAV